MRTRTDGDYAYRLGVIGFAMDALDENTKTAVILAACEHARQNQRAKEKTLEHPDRTPELADVLSTSQLQLTYEVTSALTTE